MFRKLELITNPAENKAFFKAYMCRIFGPEDPRRTAARDAANAREPPDVQVVKDHCEEGKPDLNLSPYVAKLKQRCKRKRSNI
jgi:hypothetical protein